MPGWEKTDVPGTTVDRLARWEILSIVLLILLAFGLRFHELGRMPLWLDEQCQLWVASKSTLGEVWETTRLSGPIGRFSYLDSALAWRASPTRSGLRFPGALEGIAAVAAIYVAGRYWFSAQAGLFAAALLCVSSLHIRYSREARGYALFTLLVLVQAIAFTALARRPGIIRALGLALLTLLSIGVHPLGAFASLGLALGAVGALCLDAKPSPEAIWKSAAAWTAGAMIAGGAGVYLICYRVSTVTALSPNVPANGLLFDIVDVYKALIGGYWGVLSYGVAAVGAVGIWAGFKKAEWRWPLCQCLGVAAAGAVPVVMGHYYHSWVTPRYSLFAAPFLFLLAGAGIHWLTVKAKVSRFYNGGFENKLAFVPVALAPVLAMVLLGGMTLQGRSPYDLEKDKKTDPAWPVLNKP